MRSADLLTKVVLLYCCVSPGSKGLFSSTAVADDNAAGASTQTPIVLHDCAIKALNTARLATDRPGVLSLVEPKEGDAVRTGHVIAKLVDFVPQANLEVAKLTAENDVEVRYSQKLNEVDANEYNKALDANKQHTNTVPNIEVQRLRLAEQRSKLQIEKAEHEMAVNSLKAKQAEAELKTYWIVAPFDGTVTRVDKHPGEAVKQGDPVLEVVNTDMVQVHGRLTEKDVWRVKSGAPVAVQLSVSDAELDVEKTVFQGRIGFVDVISEAGTGETRIWAEVANPTNALRPGLKATMTIFPRSTANAAAEPRLQRPAGPDRSTEKLGSVFQSPARALTP